MDINNLKEEFNKPNSKVNGIVVDETVTKALSVKQDKEEGKGLSTNDFTSALKEKLEGLTNYNDEELSGKIGELKNSLDTILKDNNADATVIDTWEEVKGFLEGLTNSQNLNNLLNGLKSDILALCANTYLPLSGGTLTGGLKIKRVSNGYNSLYLGDANGGSAEFYTKSDNENPNRFAAISTYIDGVQKGTLGIYPDGTPVYFNEINNKFKLFHEGNDGHGSELDADKLDGKHNGYVTAVNLNIIDNILNFNEILNCNGIYRWSENAANKPAGYGAMLQWSNLNNPIAGTLQHWITQLASGTNNRLYYRTRVNDGNWNEWANIAFTSDNVASANKLTTKQLTNEDLNNIKDINFTTYFGEQSNTCLNKPSNVSSFALISYRYGGGGFGQILFNQYGVYNRIHNSVQWLSWQQLATTDGAVAKLSTKQLTNEDLNTIKDMNFSSYYIYGNNTNIPTGAYGYIGLLQVFGAATQNIVQIYTLLDGKGTQYKRTCINNTWSAWKKMLTEDDITSLTNRIAALENK